MPPTFRVYGYENGNVDDILTLDQVTLAFRTPDEKMRFAEFAAGCARDAKASGDWDHVHWFNSDDNVDICLAILDPLNYWDRSAWPGLHCCRASTFQRSRNAPEARRIPEKTSSLRADARQAP